MPSLASRVAVASYREKVRRATVPGLVALDRLPVTTVAGQPAVRAQSIFQHPPSTLALPLNLKTTQSDKVLLPLDQLEPTREFLPKSGLESYVLKPRRDTPDVVHLTMHDGRERWVIQEGHTRLAAAILRGEPTLRTRVWEFTQNAAGGFDPLPRGLHQIGGYRGKLALMLADRDYARDENGRFASGGGEMSRTQIQDERSRLMQQYIAQRKSGAPAHEIAATSAALTILTHPKGPSTAGLPVTVQGKDIKVVQSAYAQRAGMQLVPVNATQFDKAWQKEQGFHVGPDGKGGIAGRYERVEAFLKHPVTKTMDAPEVTVLKDGRVGFTDGRHRMAYLRDQGVTHVPVSMDKASVAHAKKFGLLDDARHLSIDREYIRDAQGKFAETGDVPVAPGSTPVPPGMIRAYHYTNNGPAALANIVKEGLSTKYSRGASYGEPSQIWFSTQKPENSKHYVEVFVKPEELKGGVGAPSMVIERDGHWREAKTADEKQEVLDKFVKGGNNFTVSSASIPPERIVTHSSPWMAKFHAIENPPLGEEAGAERLRERILNGELDKLEKSDPDGYGKVVTAIKAKHGKKKDLSYRERLTILLDKDEHGYGSYKRGEEPTADPKHERIISTLAKELPAAESYNDTKFILPDGTRLAHGSDSHADATSALDINLFDVMRAGVVRYQSGVGAEVGGPITHAQAEHIVNGTKFTRGNTPLYVDVFTKKFRDSKRFSDRASATAVRHWINTHYEEGFDEKNLSVAEWVAVMRRAEREYVFLLDGWDEGLHPRDENGRFAGGSGSGGGSDLAGASPEVLKTHHEATQARLRGLVTGHATIADATPNLIHAGEAVADVLTQMKADGVKLPDSLMVNTVGGVKLEEHAGIRAAIHGTTITDAGSGQRSTKMHLQVEIPETLPQGANLDDAVAAVFGATVTSKDPRLGRVNAQIGMTPNDEKRVAAEGDPKYPTYDRFAARTLKDVIVHEMGHVQAGHREELDVIPRLSSGLFRSTHQIRQAMLRVSAYAGTNANEFLAEGYTRLYRGETLDEDSMKLYRSLSGPMPKGVK